MRRALAALPLLLVMAPAALAGWGPPRTVATSPPGPPLSPPSVVATGGAVSVVWSGAQVRAADLLPGGRLRVRTLGPTYDSLGSETVSVASTGGRAMATWMHACGGNCPFTLRVVRWTPGGGPARRLPPPGDGVGVSPRIAALPGGDAVVVWQRVVYSGLPGTATAYAVLAGGRWSDPGSLFPDTGTSQYDLPLATDAAGAVVVGSGRLATTRRPGAGFDRGAVAFPDGAGTLATGTAAALRPGGRAVVAAIGSPDIGRVIDTWRILTASQGASGAFGAPVTAATFPALSVTGPPALATTTDGRAVAAWLRRLDGGRFQAMAAAETAPGGPWTPARALGTATRPVGRPAIVAGRAGTVTVAWGQGAHVVSRAIGPGGRLGPTERASGRLRGCGTPALARASGGRTAVAFACDGGRRIAVAIRSR